MGAVDMASNAVSAGWRRGIALRVYLCYLTLLVCPTLWLLRITPSLRLGRSNLDHNILEHINPGVLMCQSLIKRSSFGCQTI